MAINVAVGCMVGERDMIGSYAHNGPKALMCGVDGEGLGAEPGVVDAPEWGVSSDGWGGKAAETFWVVEVLG